MYMQETYKSTVYQVSDCDVTTIGLPCQVTYVPISRNVYIHSHIYRLYYDIV